MHFLSKQYTFYSRLAIKKSVSQGYQQFAAAVTREGGSALILLRCLMIALSVAGAPLTLKCFTAVTPPAVTADAEASRGLAAATEMPPGRGGTGERESPRLQDR